MLAVLMGVSVSIAETVSDTLQGRLQIQMDEKVIYCSVDLHVEHDLFKLPMQDGIAVATEWRVKVGKKRDYWLDKNIGDITVIHRVEPDLLTRSWLLIDVSSGISLRVYNIENALDFLTRLDHLPVLDRSLLSTAIVYRAAVNIGIHIGDINEAWWSGLWSSSAASMQQEFTLP